MRRKVCKLLTEQFMIILERSEYIQTLFINNFCQGTSKQKLFFNSQIRIGDSTDCTENTLTKNVLNGDAETHYAGGFFEFSPPVKGKYICIFRPSLHSDNAVNNNYYRLWSVRAYQTPNLLSGADVAVDGPDGETGAQELNELITNLGLRSSREHDRFAWYPNPDSDNMSRKSIDNCYFTEQANIDAHN